MAIGCRYGNFVLEVVFDSVCLASLIAMLFCQRFKEVVAQAACDVRACHLLAAVCVSHHFSEYLLERFPALHDSLLVSRAQTL